MKKTLLAAALTLTFTPVFAEKKTPTYDVAQFDIAGMKLGMTEQEIKAAIKTSLEMSDGDVTKDGREKKTEKSNGKKAITKSKSILFPMHGMTRWMFWWLIESNTAYPILKKM
ncbi:hypothetical protein [Cardiobacterium valvarum]|uniref:Uncharacterized protein n=1 Tax=Cardiobacterium valvarum F0432 TaxID=797473 RepID=G9ZDD0_9GAMM|nr:hypothetical protein [Cardiobacterium valvarum]EHM55409.1 hypothetical protein HMPREF9080_00765 [Cardiobacterium valvarum F0432]